MARPPLQLRVLGPPGLFDAAGGELPIPVGKPLALLVYLAAHPEGCSRDHLSALFWPGSPRTRARASLRQALWVLRQEIGEDVFAEEDPVRLAAGVVELDLTRFRRLLQAGELDRAVELWRGQPFELFLLPELAEWEEWTEQIRLRHEHLLGAALETRVAEVREAGNVAAALDLLDIAARVQPYRAEPHLEQVACLIELRRLEEARARIAELRLAFAEDPRVREALLELEKKVTLARRGVFGGDGRTRSFPLEFVGRSREYTALLARWRDVTRHGAAVGIVRGEMGIGKTRLAEELSIAAVDGGGRLVRVKAEEAERVLDWGCLRDVVKRLYELSGATGVSPASDQILKALVPSLGAGDPGSVQAAPAGRFSSAQLVDALGDLVAAVSEDAPVVLVLDDLHWMDEASRTVLVSLARRLDREPVFVLVTCRNGMPDPELAKALALLDRHPRSAEVRLGPWGVGETRELLAFLAEFSQPDRADDVVALLHRASGGNPLFVVECLKLLRDRGALEERGDPRDGADWLLHVERVPHTLRLPASVRALMDDQLRQLSAPAGRLAAALVEAGRPESPAAIAERAGLPESEVGHGIGELLERQVVRWDEGNALAFTHDEMRRAAAERFRAPEGSGKSSPKGFRRRTALFAASVAALLLLGAATRALTSPTPPPVYGGGTIVLFYSDTILAMTPDHRGPEAWRPEALPFRYPPSQERVRRVGLTDRGGIVWFERRMSAVEEPWVVMIDEEGGERELVRTPGDDSLWELGPDGRTLLVTSDDPDAPLYQTDLFRIDLDGTGARHLARGQDFIRGAAHSPDNRRIAYRATGLVDSIVVTTPHGQRLGAVAAGATGNPIWCGGNHRIFTLIEEGSFYRLREVKWREGVVEPVLDADGQELPPAPHPTLACSPDGGAAFYAAAVDGEPLFVVHEVHSKATWVLPSARDLLPAHVAWIRPDVQPSPRALRATADTVRLQWGDRADLTAELVMSDGSRRAAEARWSAESSRVASVTPSGRIHANRLGMARVVAEWDGWLNDTVVVIVEGDEGEGTLFHDDFQILSRDRWYMLGRPIPYVEHINGEAVLVAPGDGRQWEGLVSARSFVLTRGATLEIEFRMELTRPAYQRVHLCLMEAVLPEHANRGLHVGELHRHQDLCFVYPAEELSRSDPSMALLHAGQRYSTRFDVSPHLPTDDWVHIALQLRADGQASAYVNRELVGTGPLRVRNNAQVEWRIGVIGASRETELLFRNLYLWPGERYGELE